MAGLCDGQMTADILNNCNDAVIGGIEVDVLIFNNNDIKKQSTTFDPLNNLKVTNFELKTGKTGYLLQGVKQINVLKSELVKKERSNDRYKHMFEFVVLNPTVANRKVLHDMNNGDYTVIVESKYKGLTSQEAFLIGGYDAGMQIQTTTWSSNENDGNISVTMGSIDGNEEPKPILTLLETDYATTKTLFTNKFVA
jgi:hypothetical protein